MKYFAICFLILSIIFSISNATEYHSEKGHFIITYDDNWTPITETSIEPLAEDSSNTRVLPEIELSLALKSNSIFQLPICIISTAYGITDSIIPVRLDMTILSSKNQKDTLRSFETIKVEEPIYDTLNNCKISKSIIQASDFPIGTVLYSYAFFGNNFLVHLSFSCGETLFNLYKPEFDKLANSFVFDTDVNPAPQDTSKAD
ncbi:MAG: hypothetical protein V3V99_02165 [candidate division Zixibacteria bacterium]